MAAITSGHQSRQSRASADEPAGWHSFTADLMIATTAIAEELPLFTANPAAFTGLDALMRIIPVTRPAVPHEQPRRR